MDKHKERSPARRYFAALLAPAVLAGVMQVSWPLLEPNPAAPYLLAVALSAWYGGLGPGLLSVFVSLLISDYFFIEPYFALWPAQWADMVRLGLVVVVGPIISVLCHLMQRQQRRAEINLDSLRATEERYRKLAENFPNGAVITFDRDLRVTFIAGKDLPETGISAEPQIGKSLAEIVPPEVLTLVKPHFQAALAGDSEIFECPFPDGRIYSAALAPLVDTTGRVNEVLVICQNITERKQGEAKLKQSESLLAEAQRQAHLGSWIRDLETNQVTWSDELFRLYGMEVQQAGTTYQKFLARVHPEDRVRVKALAQEAIRSQQSCSFEYRILRADGEVRILHERILVTGDEPAKATRLFGTTQDITDRKQAEQELRASEERYRELFEGARDAIYVHDLKGIYQSVNRAGEKLSGYARDEIIGKHFTDFVAPDQAELVRQKLAHKLIAHQGASYVSEIVARDGRRVPVEVNSNLIYDNGIPVGVQGVVRNITERRSAEEELRKAEQRYRGIFENAGEGIFQSTPAGQFLTANPAFAQMLGYRSPEELIRSVTDIASQIYGDPKRRDEFTRLLDEHGSVRGFKHEIFKKDGETIWLSVNARAVRGQQERILYYEGIARDITESKRAEAALRESEERFAKAFHASPAAMVIARLDDGRIIEANERALQLGGYTRAELIGRTTLEVGLWSHLEERAPHLNELRQSGSLAEVETRFRRKDGETRIARLSLELIELGDIACILGFITDVTERKRIERALRDSELKFRATFEQSAVSMATTDAHGRFLQVNAALSDYLGYSEAELLNLGLLNVIHSKDRPAASRRLVKLRTDLRSTIDHEYRYLHKDGAVLWGHTKVVTLFGSDSLPNYSITVIQDTTERRLAHEALQNFSRQLIAAQETERQTIARELHDEIGQVLTAVRIGLDHVMAKLTDEAAARRVEENITVVDEALAKVRDLSLNLHPALLDDLGLQSALRWYSKRYIKQTGIATTLTITGFAEDERLSRTLETVSYRVVQEALTNVARHAMANQAVVELWRTNGCLMLSVKDNGVGFSVARRKADKTTLGLRGMQERAEAAGGALDIKSSPAGGTEVLLILPLVDPNGNGPRNLSF